MAKKSPKTQDVKAQDDLKTLATASKIEELRRVIKSLQRRLLELENELPLEGLEDCPTPQNVVTELLYETRAQ